MSIEGLNFGRLAIRAVDLGFEPLGPFRSPSSLSLTGETLATGLVMPRGSPVG